MGMRSIYDIRYVKLKFIAVITHDTMMSVNKNSALRGGMGEMLLRANCIRDRECEICDFESECIVRRTMYSKMEIQPAFMSEGDSVGYVISCSDRREYYDAGDELIFNLTLFGKTIVYFSQYLNAFYALGREGIGKNQSQFTIKSVCNSRGKTILDGMDVHMNNYIVETLGNYIEYRMPHLGVERTGRPNEGETLKEHLSMCFRTPLTVKYHGEYMQEFNIEAIIEALKRRLYILQCFEGIESDLVSWIPSCMPNQLSSEQQKIVVKRHSNRKKTDILLKGIEGNLTMDNIDDETLELLIAGEITHIGKNTSFGFGGYRINVCEM